ncbi:Uncharacterised protein [Serratia fonticola]|nr:Uncharacterised protein [Serratia fonticola]
MMQSYFVMIVILNDGMVYAGVIFYSDRYINSVAKALEPYT